MLEGDERTTWRKENGAPDLVAAYCNAHARRDFVAGFVTGDESTDATYMVEHYREIYRLETEEKILERRSKNAAHL